MSDATEEVVSAPPCQHVSWKINIPPDENKPHSLVCVACGFSLSNLPDYHPARTVVALDAVLDLCVMLAQTLNYLSQEVANIRVILEAKNDE